MPEKTARDLPQEGAQSEMFAMADAYISRWADLDPTGATMSGVLGPETEMTDYSPEGFSARSENTSRALQAVITTPHASERDRLAADVMVERLETAIEENEVGEWMRSLRVLFSPLQYIRQCFDLMPANNLGDWERIASRMSQVPDALDGLRKTLVEGYQRRVVAGRRQVIACAEQATIWGGGRSDTPSYFAAMLDRNPTIRDADTALSRHLRNSSHAAARAYLETARFLRNDYLSQADEHDAVGPERYARGVRSLNGTNLDLIETYAWGWEELHRIKSEMDRVANRILPGARLGAAIELLESDPTRAIRGEETFRRWLQDLMDRTTADLDGAHFDIPDPVKRVEAMIAPPGSAAAMYCTPPSEDFSRPGRTWYPTLGKSQFPIWSEVSIAYHEGVPGHHLQFASARYLTGVLSRFQRTLYIAGYSEGWALYAERLMRDLGYLANPDYDLGMLRMEALRAVRVIVDIGTHLELPMSPRGRGGGSERWTPESALTFAIEHTYLSQQFLRNEIDRYLGWPGQAISYKIGEREWLAARDDVRQRMGPDFDLKEFHASALNLGPLGLAQFRRELVYAVLRDDMSPESLASGQLPDQEVT